MARSTSSAFPAPPEAESPWVQLRSHTWHPFLYQKMIGSVDPQARPGDLVAIYDKRGQLFARGLYNPRSQIAVRVLSYGSEPVDDEFWRGRLARAVELRRRLNLDADTDAYRLVHAEGDGVTGLIAERYADCLVFEIFALGIFQRWPEIAEHLAAQLDPPASLDRPGRAGPAWRMYARADAQIEAVEGFRVPRDQPDPGRVVIREHGIRYRVDVAGGHKTGFFCDQRENRRRFTTLCHRADVLDLCCYTGGFSLNAAVRGGARSVTGVDLDEAAIALARENANLNNVRIDFVHSDVFPYVRQMLANEREFDAVVLDPPKLASSRAEYDDALRKYSDLNALALQAVRPGGVLLTCSCSGLVGREAFGELVVYAARRVGRSVQILDFTGAAPDHPVMPNCPESAYLKAMWVRVL